MITVPEHPRDADFFARTRDLYDEIAVDFDRTRGKEPWEPLVKFMALDAVKDAVLVAKDATTTLDLGCGNGRNVALFLAAFPRACCIGLDLSLPLLLVARNVLPSRSRASLLQASMTHLPFRESTFDMVGSVAALHHSPSKHSMAGIAGQVARVLAAKGLFLFSVWWKWQSRFKSRVIKNILSLQRRPGLVHVPWTSAKDGSVHDREYYLLSRGECKALLRGRFAIVEWANLGGPGGSDNLFFLARASSKEKNET